jgi:1,4-alpha-glucan branching enzyme
VTTRPATTSAQKQVCFVLHSHLPWVLGHGAWPVGEEWLYQAWAQSYIPLFSSLQKLAALGHRNIASLGITPVLGAQLDNPYALNNLSIWLRNWQFRALQISKNHPARDDTLDTIFNTIKLFEHEFAHGMSPAIRQLSDTGAIEILGGPLTHPFTPFLNDDVHRMALREGLRDAYRRWGANPTGIWVPECAYRPGQEKIYSEYGVDHFLVDEPAVRNCGGEPNTPYLLGRSDVRICARDSVLSDYIWSAERGYPGQAQYRDFHDVNVDLGLQLSRVGNRDEQSKQPYIPDHAQELVHKDARHFVDKLDAFLQQSNYGAGGQAVIAIDTELLGHWWHEGVDWFTLVIETLPTYGIETITLDQATSGAASIIEIGESSWGEGKDWRLWEGDSVKDLVVMNHQAQVKVLEANQANILTNQNLSRLNNELFNQLSSDWAFMVSRNTAAHYGRERAVNHFNAIHSIIEGVDLPSTLTPFQFHFFDRLR